MGGVEIRCQDIRVDLLAIVLSFQFFYSCRQLLGLISEVGGEPYRLRAQVLSGASSRPRCSVSSRRSRVPRELENSSSGAAHFSSGGDKLVFSKGFALQASGADSIADLFDEHSGGDREGRRGACDARDTNRVEEISRSVL